MKKKPAPKKPRPEDFTWARAGLEIKICPLAMSTDHCVVVRDKEDQIFFHQQPAAVCCEMLARRLAGLIDAAMDRVDQGGRYWPRATRQGNAKTFDDVIQAMLCHPSGRQVLCRPRRPCRACREK